MTTTSVWVQLYYEGKVEPVGRPTRVSVAADGAIVDDLTDAVKLKLSEALVGRTAACLNVYPSGTLIPIPSGTKPLQAHCKLSSLNRNETVDEEPHPLIVVAPWKGTDTDGDVRQTTTLALFRNYLERSGVTATEQVMGVILKHFALSASLADTPEHAREIYFEAALLPRSATRILLQEKGISVAEVFRGSDPSKAVLLHAHENGAPRILKIATEKSILHEYKVWRTVEAQNQYHSSYLVPLRKIHFDSATIEIGDFSGESSTHPPVRCGLLMKHYQGTLSQCKIPLTVEVLLRYGQYLHKAVSTLHQAGYCHLDIKPSNIFLFEESCYLGDYGAAVKKGDPIYERTIKYYPKDGDFEAKEETDMYLLALTLLEMFGSIPQASQRNDSFTKREIHKLIAAVENEQVRDFLSSLFIL